MLERSKVFVFKGNSYSVTFPTAGQFIDIECKKVDYTAGQYGNLISSRTVGGYRATDVVDTISHLEILIPKMLGDLKVNQLQDIDAIDFLDLINSFNEQIKPWLDSWFTEFNKGFREVAKKNQEVKSES